MVDGFNNTLYELSGFQRDCLFALAWFEQETEDVYTGSSDLRELLENQYRKDVHPDRLGPNLEKLEDNGLVNKKRSSEGDLYILTEEGIDMIETYYNSLEFMEE